MNSKISTVTFTYKNHRGEISTRLVRPIMIAFGMSGFHPESQWLLHGWDFIKMADRTFAMKDIKDREQTPQTEKRSPITGATMEGW